MTRRISWVLFNRGYCIAAIIGALLILSFANTANAWPPGGNGGGPGSGGGGGGGGTGTYGGGLISFNYYLDLYTMNDDGSGLALFTGYDTHYYGPWGEPSRDLHGGKRWFVDLGWPEDHFQALSDAGDVVLFTPQPGLKILGAPRWGVADALISFEGVLWDVDITSPTYGQPLEGGLYAFSCTSEANGDLAAEGPAMLVFEVPLVVDTTDNDRIRPDMREHDWAPDGTQFVYDSVASKELDVGDVLTGDVHQLFDASADGGVARPKWSPAGDRIMFFLRSPGSYPEVALIGADGLNLKTLVRGAPGFTWQVGVWSPTGSHLLVVHRDHHGLDNYILRMNADGSGKTRITDKNMWSGVLDYPRPTGWRQ